MGYEIFYDKFLIDLGDKGVLPVYQFGSNNCFEYDGRPEKNWDSMNTFNSIKKVIFKDKKEIKKEWENLFKDDNNDSRDTGLRSRNNMVTNKELIKWASSFSETTTATLEEWRELGNSFYGAIKDEDYKSVLISTTKELLEAIEKYGDKIIIGISNRNRCKKQTKRVAKQKTLVDFYYVIKLNNNHTERYFNKKTKYGYRYSFFADTGAKALKDILKNMMLSLKI